MSNIAGAQGNLAGGQYELQNFADQVASGELGFIHVDAVPRSMSTILPIALCEAETVDPDRAYRQMDEPLNWQTRHLGLVAIAPKLSALKDDGRPTTVIEKSTSRNVYPTTFEDICRFAGGVIFTVRNPMKQMHSLSERVINDLVHGKGAGNETKLKELSADERRVALEQVDEFLAVSGHHDGILPDGERPYMQPSWREILDNFRQAQAQGVPHVVVDGTSLTLRPEYTLRQLCSILGLPYASTMPQGWSTTRGRYQKDSTNWPTERTEQGALANGWVSRATSTTGIQNDITPTIELASCPPRMRTYIEEVAMPAYRELVSSPTSNVNPY